MAGGRRDRGSGGDGANGPDALDVDEETFVARLGATRGNVKAALMDQEVVAGIGNELSDEILWRARLAPHRPITDLDPGRLAALHRTTQAVLHDALPHGHIPTDEGWLASVRGVPVARCPRCDGSVRAERIGGRTAYWCPACQE